ncbi:MAG: PEP-CTERM sorting domain-containing protein [Planctomycetia bacterium]|nr:PEP-CTERM sorting domain-containing protein [Planctomycetia bacterium]
MGFDYGDYLGVDFFNGVAHAVWADNSNSTGDNPDFPADKIFDVYTAAIRVPEPSTILLLAVGGVAACAFARRKPAAR